VKDDVATAAAMLLMIIVLICALGSTEIAVVVVHDNYLGINTVYINKK
jgi:hypothetical protein